MPHVKDIFRIDLLEEFHLQVWSFRKHVRGDVIDLFLGCGKHGEVPSAGSYMKFRKSYTSSTMLGFC